MKKYLVIYLKPTNYYIEVKKYGWNGEEKDVINYKELCNEIVKANSKEEIYIDNIINIIELGDE